jgi:hypothetical protein
MLRHAKPDMKAVCTHGNFGKALEAQRGIHGSVAEDKARFGINPMTQSGWHRAEIERSKRKSHPQVAV